MNEEKLKEIEEMSSKLEELKSEIEEENRKELIPMLSRYGTLVYEGHFTSMEISFEDRDIKNEFMKILDQQMGSYQFHVVLSKNITFTYEDGLCRIRFCFNQEFSKYQNSVMNFCKQNKIKINFTNFKDKLKKIILKETETLEKIEILEKEFQSTQ